MPTSSSPEDPELSWCDEFLTILAAALLDANLLSAAAMPADFSYMQTCLALVCRSCVNCVFLVVI